ncbi:tetratricopeptide repeat protein [Haloferula sp. BvORR071]|uniref:tetratricopeptide repeat protein n=1 Tax=Haloferula sp. BvORR071 TaxID=1396141 RepID=UPI00054F7130|nr:tetratricopeptide repeat protein [Haloferula sp. BvORR071]
MKWGFYVVMILAVAFAWMKFAGAEKEIQAEKAKLSQMINSGDEMDEDIAKQQSKVESSEGAKTGSGILLAFMTAGLVGIVFVIHVLPAIAHRFTHAVYDSGEEVEKDPMHDGRAKVAQGDWEGAIEAFRQAAIAQPLNRLPWVEIAKIQLDHLEDAPAAVQTLRTAIEGQEWEENDAAYLMFRVAEIYETELSDHNSAAVIMNQVIEQFPESRHSANARHKLREWGLA